MELQDNLENKAKFFSQYYGQKVMRTSITALMLSDPAAIPTGEWFLQLKPLSAISDEHLEEIRELLGAWIERCDFMNNGSFDYNSFKEYIVDVFVNGFGGIAISNIQSYITTSDHLRSKGYILPFNGLSCEELLNRGWAVLEKPYDN